MRTQHLDKERPRRRGVVIYGEAGAQMHQRPVSHFQSDHYLILMLQAFVMQSAFKRRQPPRPTEEVEYGIEMMGQYLTQDTWVMCSQFLRVIKQEGDPRRAYRAQGAPGDQPPSPP